MQTSMHRSTWNFRSIHNRLSFFLNHCLSLFLKFQTHLPFTVGKVNYSWHKVVIIKDLIDKKSSVTSEIIMGISLSAYHQKSFYVKFLHIFHKIVLHLSRKFLAHHDVDRSHGQTFCSHEGWSLCFWCTWKCKSISPLQHCLFNNKIIHMTET